MGEIKLLPCPFCGGKGIFTTISNESDHYCVGFEFKVKCEDCGVESPNRYGVSFSLTEEGKINTLEDERGYAANDWNFAQLKSVENTGMTIWSVIEKAGE